MNAAQWKYFQAALIMLGFTAGGTLIADGIVQESTRSAIRVYQQHRGIATLTGRLCRETAIRLTFEDKKLPAEPTLKQLQAYLIISTRDRAGDVVANGTLDSATLRRLGDLVHRYNELPWMQHSTAEVVFEGPSADALSPTASC